LVTSCVQILVVTAVFTGKLEISGPDFFSPVEGGPVIIYSMYLALSALDAILVVTSALLLAAVELDQRGARLVVPWLVFLPIYVTYEAVISIYFFYTSLVTRQAAPPITGVLGYLLVPLAYWVIKFVLNIFGFLAVFSRLQQLKKLIRLQEEQDKELKPLTCYTAYPITDYVTSRPTNSKPPIKIPVVDYPTQYCNKCKCYNYCKCYLVDQRKCSVCGCVVCNCPSYVRNPLYSEYVNPPQIERKAFTRRLPRTIIRGGPAPLSPTYSGYPLAYNDRRFMGRY